MIKIKKLFELFLLLSIIVSSICLVSAGSMNQTDNFNKNPQAYIDNIVGKGKVNVETGAEASKISSNGQTLTLKGESGKSVTIDLASLRNLPPGVTVDIAKDGSIIFNKGKNNEIKVSSGEIIKNKDGSFDIKNAEIKLNDNTFKSSKDKSLTIRFDDSKISIKSRDEITETDKDGTQKSSFIGEISIYQDGHRDLEKGTAYTTYDKDGKKYATYTVNQKVEFFNKEGNPSQGAAYIKEIEGVIKCGGLGEGNSISNGKDKIIFKENSKFVEEGMSSNIAKDIRYDLGNGHEVAITNSNDGDSSYQMCSYPCKNVGQNIGTLSSKIEQFGENIGENTKILASRNDYLITGLEIYRLSDGRTYAFDKKTPEKLYLSNDGGNSWQIINQNGERSEAISNENFPNPLLGHTFAQEAEAQKISPYALPSSGGSAIIPRNNLERMVQDRSSDPTPGKFTSEVSEDGKVLQLKYANPNDQDNGIARISAFVEADRAQLQGYTNNPTDGYLSTQEFAKYLEDKKEAFFAHDIRVSDMVRFFNTAGDDLTPLEKELRQDLINRGFISQNNGVVSLPDSTDRAVISFARRENTQSDSLNNYAFEHEYDHALYFTNPEYRNFVTNYYNQLTQNEKDMVREMMGSIYNPKDTDLMTREFAAYVSASRGDISLQCKGTICGYSEHQQYDLVNKWRSALLKQRSSLGINMILLPMLRNVILSEYNFFISQLIINFKE